MFASGVRAVVAAKPIDDSDIPRIAAAAALLAAVPAALMTLGDGGSLREYLPILALIVLVTLGIFAWGLPSARDLDYAGPSAVALALSLLSVLTLLLFWTGIPAVLAAGAIVLGRLQPDLPEDRRATAAVKIGAAAVLLYLFLFAVDFLQRSHRRPRTGRRERAWDLEIGSRRPTAYLRTGARAASPGHEPASAA